MRSRLHSDIGRFTGLGTQSVVGERERNRGSKSYRKEGGGRERKSKRAILGGKIELGFARVSRLLFASVIRLTS